MVYVTATGSLEYSDNDFNTQPIDGIVPQTHFYYDATQEIEFLYFFGYTYEE